MAPEIFLSPSKGLLIFTPFLLLPLLAAPRVVRDRSFPLGLYLLAWIGITTIILSQESSVVGRLHLGTALLQRADDSTQPDPRPCGGAARHPARVRGRSGRPARHEYRSASRGCLLLHRAVGIRRRNGSTNTPERLWDWSDPEILRCVRVGLAEGHRPFEFLTTP